MTVAMMNSGAFTQAEADRIFLEGTREQVGRLRESLVVSKRRVDSLLGNKRLPDETRNALLADAKTLTQSIVAVNQRLRELTPLPTKPLPTKTPRTLAAAKSSSRKKAETPPTRSTPQHDARPLRVAIMKGVVTDAERVASVLAEQIDRGFSVQAFQAIGNDLVILYTEPYSSAP